MSIEPFLQVIHISDMHVQSARTAAPAAVRRAERIARRLPGGAGLADKLRDGTAPHDPWAPAEMLRFIEEVARLDPSWAPHPTWLVDTGDHTTFGDRPSIQDARQLLNDFTQVCRGSSLSNLHGNHDAWPETVPIFAPTRIAQHTAALVAQGYAVRSAQVPLRAPLPSGKGEVQLYTLDSVLDGAWPNFWARGSIPDVILDQLEGMIDQHPGPPGALHMRLLATHHPVCHPDPRPFYEMVLENHVAVGGRLDSTTPAMQHHPLAHLVFSGHTHALFPEHGKLPKQARACNHSPLGTDQCQLIVGSLMQVDRLGKRGNCAHQCVVLRFYQDPSDPGVVLMERLLAARNPLTGGHATGGYRFVEVPGNPGEYAEECSFAL